MSDQEAQMGLMDILNGMQNGPRGQAQPSGRTGGGGMSPITMALLGLLAYKAVKSFANASSQGSEPAPSPSATSGGGLGGLLGRLLGAAGGQPASAQASGDLAQLLPAELGNLFGSGAAGTLVSNGLGTLVQDLQERGYGREAQSWVSNGPNEEIAPNDLENALGADTLESLSRQTGMRRADLLAGLSQHLPELVHQLTPNGRLPTEDEASRMS